MFRAPITQPQMATGEDLAAVAPIQRSSQDEVIGPLSKPLVPDGAESGADLRALSRVPAMLHLLLPIAWAVTASMGLLAHTVLNYFFLIFYGIFANSPRRLSSKRSRPPSLLVIISLVISVVYIVGEVAVFLLTKSGEIGSIPDWLQDYFEIVPFSKRHRLPNVIFAYIVVGVLDAVFLVVSGKLDSEWFKECNITILRKLNALIGMLFIVAIALVSESWGNMSGGGRNKIGDKVLTAIPIVFLFISLAYGLLSRPLGPTLSAAVWFAFLLLITLYLLTVASDLIIDVQSAQFGRWARIASVCLAAYLATIFYANSSSHIRLFYARTFPLIIQRLTPLISVACTFFFCLTQMTWISFVPFAVACMVSFLPLRLLAKTSGHIFAMIVLAVLGQTIAGLISSIYQFAPKGLHIVVAVAAIFMSGSSSAGSDIGSHIVENPMFLKVLSIVSFVFLLAFYSVSSYVALTWPSALINLNFLVSIVVAVMGIFHPRAFLLSMFVSFGHSAANIVIVLLDRDEGIAIPDNIYRLLFIVSHELRPKYLGYDLWQPLVLFVLAFVLHQALTDPLSPILSSIEWVGIPALLVLVIVFGPNSVFKIIDALCALFLLGLKTAKYPKLVHWLLLVAFFEKALQLACIGMYHFEDLRNYIHSSVLRVVLGFPENGEPRDDFGRALIITLFVLAVSFRSSFRVERQTVEFPPVVLQYAKVARGLFRQFAFYLFMLAVFLGEIVDNSGSFIQMVFLIGLSLQRIFVRVGRGLSRALFVLAYLMQLTAALIPRSISIRGYFDLVGPSVDKALSHLVCLVSIFAAFQYSLWKPEQLEIPKTLKLIGGYVARNLLVALQIVLVFSAVRAGKSLGPVCALFAILLILRTDISRGFLVVVNVLMLAINIYVMFFAVMPQDVDDHVLSVYFLLSGIKTRDIAFAFFNLFVSAMLLEFGIGLLPGFGYTILTAYAFPIFSSIIFVIACSIHNFPVFAFALFWFFIVYIGTKSPNVATMGIKISLFYVMLILIVKSIRSAPFWPAAWPDPGNDYLGILEQSDQTWIAIFALEFLLLAMFRSVDHQEVQERQSQRRNWRMQRQGLFVDLQKLNEDIIHLHFDVSLSLLQVDFQVLTEEYDLIPSVTGLEDESRTQAEGRSVLTFVGDFLRQCVQTVLDIGLRSVIHIVDINLEPGVSVVSMTKLLEFMRAVHDRYRDEKGLEVPEDWQPFSKTIPYSFPLHYRSIALLKLHRDRVQKRWLLFKRYLSLDLRVIVPLLLLSMTCFYPLKESSFVALIWLFISLTSIGFKIPGYRQFLIFSSFVLVLRALLQLPYLRDPVEDGRAKIGPTDALNTYLVFGLTVKGIFGLDCTIFILSVLAVCFADLHPSVPNPWEGDGVRQRLYSRFTTVAGRKVKFSVVIFLLDFIGFLVLLFGFGGWRQSESGFSLVVGGSSLNPGFVVVLLVHFCFIIGVPIASMSRSVFAYSIVIFLDAIVSFCIIFWAIPHMTEGGCWNSPSWQFLAFVRIAAQLFMSCYLACGFRHSLPKVAVRRPLFTVIYEVVYRLIPFLSETVTVMQWIASKTTIALFDYLILATLKSKLRERQALRQLFPTAKQKG
jgi:hypothetical protein